MELEREQAEELLDHVEQQLYEMLALAQKAARADCTDGERARLQKGMDLLRGVLDYTVEQYEQAGEGAK